MNGTSTTSPTALRAAIDEIIAEIQIPTSNGETPISFAAVEALKTETSELNALIRALAVMHRPSLVQT